MRKLILLLAFCLIANPAYAAWKYNPLSSKKIDYYEAGSPTTADYLVGTANGDLSAEIVVGTTALSLVNLGSKLLGGSATTADLSLQTTSGVGATGADMHFLVGSNGGTEAMTILNSGNTVIGKDLVTDRWLVNDTNTMVGVGVAGAGTLANASGTQGLHNTLLGYQSLYSATTNWGNVAIGYQSLYNTTADKNIGIGYQAGYGITSGSGLNIAIGEGALYGTGSYSDCIAIGTKSFYSNNGNANLGFGHNAGYSNTGGAGNLFMGYQAARYNTNGNNNLVIGRQAWDFQTGSSNVIVGPFAATGVDPDNIGNNSNNVIVGYGAGGLISTGSNNILFGYNAGNALTTGGTNIVIGYDIDLPAVGSTNMLNIGNLIYATGLTSTGTTISTGKVGIGTATPGEELVVAGDGDFEDETPHVRLTDTTASEDDFEMYADNNTLYLSNVTDSTVLLQFQSDNHAYFPRNLSVIGSTALSSLTLTTPLDISSYTNLSAGRSTTMNGDAVDADEETYFYTWRYGSFDPVATDDILQVDYYKKAVTLTEFRCYSDQTTVVQLQRNDGTAANIFTADVTCDSGGGSACASGCDTTLVAAEDNCAATDKLDLVTVSVSGTPTKVTMQLFGTLDD